jgi:hypothetical protein
MNRLKTIQEKRIWYIMGAALLLTALIENI